MGVQETTDPDDPIAKLRELCPEGSTIYTIAVHRTRGNTSASIQCYRLIFEPCVECDGTGRFVYEAHQDALVFGDSVYGAEGVGDPKPCDTCNGTRGRVDRRELSMLIARAGLGRFDKGHDAIRVGGVGHNRGLHLVSTVAAKLYGREGALRQEWL